MLVYTVMRTALTILATCLFAVFPGGAPATETTQASPDSNPTNTTLTPEQQSYPAAPLDRAVALLNSGKPEEALETLAAYTPLREELSGYHYVYARALVDAGKAYASIEHYRLAYIYAAAQADKERMLLERADVYASMGYHSEAVVHYGMFLKLFPKSNMAEQAEISIAEAYSGLRQFREALAHFEKAGSSLRVLYGKANALQSLGRTKEAHKIYSELIENDPEVTETSSETLYNIGENFRQSDRFAEAKVYFFAVKDEAFRFRSAIGLGQIAIKEKRFDDALGFFDTAAKSPDRFVRRDAILWRAETNMAVEKYDDAETALRAIRAQYYDGKEYDRASLMLAKLYRVRGKYKEASDLLKGLIIRRTPSIEALDELEALMLVIKDRDPEALAKIWTSTGRWLLDPSRSESIVKIAQGLRYSGRPLIDVCAWLIRQGTGNTKSQARVLMADFYAGLGETTIAMSYLERARIKGHSDEALRVKARAHLGNNDALRASQAIMSVKKMGEADMLLLLDAMQSLKNIEQAASFCKRMFEKERLSVQARVRFADILYNAGRTDDALAQYRAAAAMEKPGAKDDAAVADLEWAHYRIAELARGETRMASLKAIQASKNAVGRFAAAELKRSAFPKRSDR